MKRLFLLRHAKAKPATDPLADSERPLAERGERDAQLIGARLRQHYRPSLIVSSAATRALQTAELVATAVGYPSAQIARDPRLYLAEPVTLAAVVAAQSAAAETLLVVGHNPGLTELTHEFLPGFHVADLPTCAIVGLEFAVAHWSETDGATPALVYYDFPKNTDSPLTSR